MDSRPIRVLGGEPGRKLVLIGCGGTGGYLLQQVCRLLYGLRSRESDRRAAPAFDGFGQDGQNVPPVPELLLVDGDTVSETNLLRQYFLPCDVGKKKARVLSERYGAAYGLRLYSYAGYLTAQADLKALVPEGSIVAGCVDNAKTRALLHHKLSSYRDVVYLDAGNAAVEPPALSGTPGAKPTREVRARERESGWEGQVLCGVRKGGETVIPLPADQMPDLIEDDGELLPSEVPCGQIVISNPQRHLTNVMAATVLTGYLTPLLSDGTLLHRMSLFCARRGYVRSYPALEALDEVALA